MTWVVVDASGLSLERERLVGMGSRWECEKFMRASFESSKGELCEIDQLKPPEGCSIMSLMMV